MAYYVCVLRDGWDIIDETVHIAKRIEKERLRGDFRTLVEYMLEEPPGNSNEFCIYEEQGAERIRRLFQETKENPRVSVKLVFTGNDNYGYDVRMDNKISDYLPNMLQRRRARLGENKKDVLLLELIVLRVACEPPKDYNPIRMNLSQK